MNYPAEADIIVMLRHLVNALHPYAKAQNVKLQFKTDLTEIVIPYYPEEISHDFISLLSRIIEYTPEKELVTVSVTIINDPSKSLLKISIKNTGINLARILEITQGLKQEVVIQTEGDTGTFFELTLHVQQKKPEENEFKQIIFDVTKRLPSFYAEIRKRLYSHFTKAENLVALLSTHHPKDAAFLQKINAVIFENLDRDGFNANHLSKAMAMSRAQLYRRLQPLIRQSPGCYIRSVRIQKAKELLETTEFSVGEVAFKTGFLSQSHFTKVFIEQYGVKPSLFRRKR